MYVLALVLATSNLLSTVATLIGGQSLQWRLSLATGLVWAAVWVWHRWMWRHPRRRPLDLLDVPTVLGSYIGLVIGVSGAVTALSTLLDAALRGALAAATVGKPWWVSALQSLVWAVGGGLVWWWHWKHDGGRRLRGDLASVGLIAVGVLGAGVLTLGGAGVPCSSCCGSPSTALNRWTNCWSRWRRRSPPQRSGHWSGCTTAGWPAKVPKPSGRGAGW